MMTLAAAVDVPQRDMPVIRLTAITTLKLNFTANFLRVACIVFGSLVFGRLRYSHHSVSKAARGVTGKPVIYEDEASRKFETRAV